MRSKTRPAKQKATKKRPSIVDWKCIQDLKNIFRLSPRPSSSDAALPQTSRFSPKSWDWLKDVVQTRNDVQRFDPFRSNINPGRSDAASKEENLPASHAKHVTFNEFHKSIRPIMDNENPSTSSDSPGTFSGNFDKSSVNAGLSSDNPGTYNCNPGTSNGNPGTSKETQRTPTKNPEISNANSNKINVVQNDISSQTGMVKLTSDGLEKLNSSLLDGSFLSEDGDDDLNFLKSLMPYLKQLQPLRKLSVRSQIQNIIAGELTNQREPITRDKLISSPTEVTEL